VAWVFVRLKFILTRNRLRRSGPMGVLGFALMWLGALGLGAVLGLLAGIIAGSTGSLGMALLLAVASLAWLAVPMVAAALDETVEPRRLELLPIPRRKLIAGLLAATLLGPGALTTALFLLGAILGSGLRWTNLVPALLLGAVFLVSVVGAARWVTTMLSDLLRSRFGRDAVVLGTALLVAAGTAGPVLFTDGSDDPLHRLRVIGEVLSFLPAGALGRAIGLTSEGEWLAAIPWAVYGVAATFLILVGWQKSLHRLQSRSPQATAARALRHRGALAPRWWPGPSDPASATAGKELRYLRRDPRFRSQAIGLVVALAAVAFVAGRVLFGTEYAPFLAVVVAWMAASTTGFNQFGLDDRSFWGYLVSGVDLRKVQIGKNAAIAVIGLPVLVVAAVAAAIMVGTFRHFPAAVLAGISMLLIWLAVGNVVSVLGAFPLPESNLFGSRNLSGSVLFASLGGLAAAGAITIPAAVALIVPLLILGSWGGVLGAILALALSVVIYRLSLRVSAGLLQQRALRLLEVLDRA
jgi:ABC-2 type transport system permease protein